MRLFVLLSPGRALLCGLAALSIFSLPVTGSAAETKILTLEECRAFVEGGGGILLDARGAKFYARGHIAGALSLPVNDFDAGYRRLQSRLEEDRDRRIVIYCSSVNCPDSDRLRGKLEKLGYRRVEVFKGGLAAWWKARLPMETGGPPSGRE
jgi:rhodanese-related sulfurtransferase